MTTLLVATVVLTGLLAWALRRDWHTHLWGPPFTATWVNAPWPFMLHPMATMRIQATTRRCVRCQRLTVQPVGGFWTQVPGANG